MDGVRFFLNTDFRENPTDLLPMTYSITQDPQTGQNKYDLCSRNPGFWKRFRSAINAMHAQGYHKILFTMSHNYNGGACTYCPWGYNTQNWTSANGNWMNSWSNLASEQPPSCNIPGVTNARDWIIHEYIELTRRMYLYGGRTLTIEIHNEPAHSGANLSEIQQAHIDLINALRSEFPDLNIQVNLDPIEGLNSTTHCPDIDAGSLSTMWSALSSMVDVWALHTFIPDCVDPSLNVYPSGSLFWTMFESGKLEISADGQFCSNQGGDIHLKCQCCHILTGETLDMALRQSKNRGYAQKFAPFSFEHSWGGETLAGHTASAHRNYDDWDVWENDEIACLRQRADAGDLNECGGGALAPRSSVIKHILGNGNFNDGSCLIVPYAQRNNTIFLLWNSTFSTAGHEYTCSLTGDNLNSPGDDIVGLASTTLDCSSGSCSATYTLTCGGGIPTQNLQVSVCGDNACTKNACETASNCDTDCGCNFNNNCERSDRDENENNCIDCAQPDIDVNNLDGDPNDNNVVIVSPNTWYTVSWENNAPTSANCTVYRKDEGEQDYSPWVDAWQVSSKQEIFNRPQDTCSSDLECYQQYNDPCYSCEGTSYIRERFYKLVCSENNIEKLDPVSARTSYTVYRCVYQPRSCTN